MQNSDIIRFWGWDNLRRWPREDLRDVAIPGSSKSYLVDVGLPRSNESLRFDDETSLLLRLPGKPNYRCIGFDYVVPVCLDERRNGCVIDAGTEFGDRERYINACVELFGECLVYYRQYRMRAQAAERASPEGDLSDLIATTAQLLRRADPTAFEDEENWWPVVIEQMEYGML